MSKYVSVRSAAAGRKGEGTELAGFAGSLKRTELAGSAGSLCLNLSPFKPIKPINTKGPKLTDPDDVCPIARAHHVRRGATQNTKLARLCFSEACHFETESVSIHT